MEVTGVGEGSAVDAGTIGGTALRASRDSHVAANLSVIKVSRCYAEGESLLQEISPTP